MQGLFFSCTSGCTILSHPKISKDYFIGEIPPAESQVCDAAFSCNDISLWKVLVQEKEGG
jgi:hypothetical protein